MPPVPEISPRDLFAACERGEAVQVLDVRAPARLEAGRVDCVPDDRFFNCRGSELLALEDPASLGLDRDRPLAVVCGLGNDSRRVAEHLNARGFDAASLRGGVRAWMGAIQPREVDPPAGLDRLVQFDRFGKGALGYLLVRGTEALVLDAARDIAPYRDAAGHAGARIVAVADTHAHADYISGGPALAAACCAPYHLHPADAVYPYDGTPGTIPFSPLAEERVLRVGDCDVAVTETPGHTEGSVSFRVGDAAFTGDFLFVRSVGRPDLGGKVEEWTGVLWRSLERVRAAWPTGTRVFPAHYSSESERGPGRVVGATLAGLADVNEPFALRDEDAFRAWILERAGAFPEAYRTIKAINLGLEKVDPERAEELEAGRNECALG